MAARRHSGERSRRLSDQSDLSGRTCGLPIEDVRLRGEVVVVAGGGDLLDRLYICQGGAGRNPGAPEALIFGRFLRSHDTRPIRRAEVVRLASWDETQVARATAWPLAYPYRLEVVDGAARCAGCGHTPARSGVGVALRLACACRCHEVFGIEQELNTERRLALQER
jgi:hypothetical protein